MKYLNRLLTDEDRELYKPIIETFWETCPDIMARKFPRANVQQAFVYETVANLLGKYSRVLSVGSYEDTAFETLMLRNKPYVLVGIDPLINFDLASYKSLFPTLKFDIIFSTSVLEHVVNDELFVADMCDLLAPGGVGVLTMDFNNNYKPGDRLPYTDVRFYTWHDLAFRLQDILKSHGCKIFLPTKNETVDWSGEPDFEYDGCKYSFATFVFTKDVK